MGDTEKLHRTLVLCTSALLEAMANASSAIARTELIERRASKYER